MSSEGFLARWSRLKRREPEGPGSRALPEPARLPDPDRLPAQQAPGDRIGPDDTGRAAADGSGIGSRCGDPRSCPDASGTADVADREAAARDSEAPLPDVESLTPESDFRPFMRSGVDAVQRNAALKKLFADPHFNVMDGLDVYIDDYSRPDPISPRVLRQLVQSDSLGLFRELHRPSDATPVAAGSEAAAPPAGARADPIEPPAAETGDDGDPQSDRTDSGPDRADREPAVDDAAASGVAAGAASVAADGHAPTGPAPADDAASAPESERPSG